MKKYITVLTIVTVVSIIVGSVIHLYSCRDNMHFSYHFSSDNDGDSKMGEVFDKDFDNIEIGMALVEVEVKDGDAFKVDYKGKDKYKPVIKSDGDTLVVSNGDRNFPVSSIGAHGENKLTVTIPNGKVFDNAKIESVMADFDIDTLNAKNLDIEVPTGEIEIRNSKGDNLKAEVVKGDLRLEGDFTDLDITAVLGNVEIDLAQDVNKYNVEANSELGSIECGDVKAHGASTSSQNGDLGNIKVECSMGSVKIK